MSVPSAPRKGVKTISISSLADLALLQCNVIDGRTADVDEIGAYGDPMFTSVPRPILHAQDFSVIFLDEGGTATDTLIGKVGTVQSVTITVTLDDGTGSNSATRSITGNFVIVSAEGDSISVDGERKSVCNVVLRNHYDDGEDDSSNG